MKMIKHLKTSWFTVAILAAVVVGEFVARQICTWFDLRFAPAAIAALCIGIVAAFVAWQYDGTED